MASRLEEAIQQWKSQQNRYEKLFSEKTVNSVGFRRERLRQLNVLAARYRHDADADEGVLRLLKVERGLWEQQAHVGIWQKWWNRFSARKEALEVKKQNAAQAQEAQREFRARMAVAGFERYTDYAIGLASQTNKAFVLQVSSYVGADRRVDFTLQFKPGAGGIQFDGYHATLVEKATGLRRTQFYAADAAEAINHRMAAQLLQGKAIIAPGPVTGQYPDWIQYDFTEKTPAGAYRLARYDGERFNPTLLDAIAALPTDLPISKRNAESLLQQLWRGDPVYVDLALSGKAVTAELVADPNKDSLLARTPAGKEIQLNKHERENNRKRAGVRTQMKVVK